jgi:hypothetical protein
MARRPSLGYICRTLRVVAEPTLELLISNPLNLRASVAATFNEWDLTPSISNRTLQGSDFFEHLTRVARGLPLLGKKLGHLMAAVVAAVVRGGRTFSGGAATSIVDDVGGERDKAPRPFGCCDVMITCARTSSRFSMVGPVCQWQTMSHAVNARGARGSREHGSPRSIN